MEKKRLTKGTDRKICGVCSGVSNYFGWDTTFVRVGTALLTICCPAILVAYFVAAIVMPNEDTDPDM